VKRAILLRALALVAWVAIGGGCTIRYSQTVVGSIERLGPSPVKNQDLGVEVGIGGPSAAPAVVTFSEPESPADLLTLPCEVANAQVDYRGAYYAYYLAVNFPQTRTVTYCVAP
jgi:hypothetical protein